MEIKVIKSSRKTMSLSVNDDLNVVVRVPYYVSQTQISKFVSDNSFWIEKAVKHKKEYLNRLSVCEEQRALLLKTARQIIPQRVSYYSSIMNLYPSSVKITSAKKRFGSCSSKNALCFSYMLMQYPIEAVDYVVVHELAHIKFHNHSSEFYSLIENYMPDYKKREKMLKSYT